jgi:hypothetical protein
LLHHLHYISIKILPIPTRHDIAEILLKVALNTKNQLINQSTNAVANKNANSVLEYVIT